MSLPMFKDVVVPLLGMTETVLVMISTPVDSFNFYSKLLDLSNDNTGKPLFLTVYMKLSCDRCIALNRAVDCKHRLKFLPPWKSDEKQDMMKMILRDSSETMVRENMGVILDSGASIIEERFLTRWLEQPRYIPIHERKADCVVITVDPNGSDAATASEMAIVSTALLWGERVVRLFCVKPDRRYVKVAHMTCKNVGPGHLELPIKEFVKRSGQIRSHERRKGARGMMNLI